MRPLKFMLALKRQLLAKHKNAVFIWIPKTAGTSTFDILENYGAILAKEVELVETKWKHQTGLVSFGHMSYGALLEKNFVSKEFDNTAFKFSVCRNPYDRTISLFNYLFHHKIISNNLSFLDFLRALSSRGCPPIGLYNRLGWSQCNPQVEWIRGINVHRMIKFETMIHELGETFHMLGIGAQKIPHLNPSKKHSSKGTYLTPECIEIVNEFYDDDFTEFGYKKR